MFGSSLGVTNDMSNILFMSHCQRKPKTFGPPTRPDTNQPVQSYKQAITLKLTRDFTICVAKAKALLIYRFVFEYADCCFFFEAAHILLNHFVYTYFYVMYLSEIHKFKHNIVLTKKCIFLQYFEILYLDNIIKIETLMIFHFFLTPK